MPLGGLGPLWAMIDAERFSECPWALYHIEVQA